jgi:4-amino-4-deoxy-L-arabinose transferase-like glycosyltransferase
VIQVRRLLPLVLFVALAVRLWGLGFGLPYIIARPDETEIAGPAVGFLSGDLRAPNFVWPTLFIYAAAFFYLLYYLVTRPFGGYASLVAFAESRRQSVAPFLYITRAMSAVMGVLAVWWTHAICRRLFDETIAIAAALFLALSFLHVRDSHFGVADVAMTSLVMLALRAIVKWRDTGMRSDAAVAGLITGLAGSTKYNALGMCIPFGVALVQRTMDDRRSGSGRSARRRFTLTFLTFVGATAVGFFGASPYILIDWTRFVTDVSSVGSHLAAGHGALLSRGWSYYPQVVLPAAIGWPMFVAAMAGMLVLLVTRFRDASVVFAFPIAYYLLAGRGYTVFARYILPAIPFLCIGAAWAVVTAARRLASHAAPVVRSAAVAAAVIAVVAPTARHTWQLDRLLSTMDNRVVVAREVADVVGPARSLYQSGETYGYIPMMIDGRQVARITRYNEAAGRFDSGEPDFILLQRSPLIVYSAVPPWLDRMVHERYVLVKRFPTGNDRAGAVYDQQDAFYLPLNGLYGISRPGPSFELYQKTREM